MPAQEGAIHEKQASRRPTPRDREQNGYGTRAGLSSILFLRFTMETCILVVTGTGTAASSLQLAGIVENVEIVERQ